MTKEQLAATLNGREYGSGEITDAEAKEAKRHRLLVVTGASDDLCELRGAIYEEVNCYEGGEFFVKDGTLLEAIQDEERDLLKKHKVLDVALAARADAIRVEILWDEDGYSWTYKTATPHAAFDILENGEKYCRGIVIDLKAATL